jgi:hypothetical protein
MLPASIVLPQLGVLHKKIGCCVPEVSGAAGKFLNSTAGNKPLNVSGNLPFFKK